LVNCREINNAAALAAKGYLSTDADELEAAILALGVTDTTQETGKGAGKTDTATVTQAVNALYDDLLNFQEIAVKVFPADLPANLAIQTEFRIGTFPGTTHTPAGTTTSTGTPPVTPPATPMKASNPTPANNATGVDHANVQFLWTNGSGNLRHGTTAANRNREVISATSPVNGPVQLGPFLPNTQYFWSVDIPGAPQGDIWNFTTAP
jgi:hypothetical protein